MVTEKEVPESELKESALVKDLRTAADILGGELSMKYDNNDMSYRVYFTRNGHTFNISLEALEAVCSIAKQYQMELLNILRVGTSGDDDLTAMICPLCTSEPKPDETMEQRALKLKAIAEKVIPEKMKSYISLYRDMALDMFGRFDSDTINSCLIQDMKMDLIKYIASI